MASSVPVDKISFNYTRVSHPYQDPLGNFIKLNHEFLATTEQGLLATFKDGQDKIDANVFLEIDFDKFLDDLNFHIVSYDDFSSFKDPTETKQLLYEMKSITDNVLQNVDANAAACENLQKINILKSKLTEQNNDIKGAFGALESQQDFYTKTNELITLFSTAEQLAQKYSKLVGKIKQFELFFCQDIDALHASLRLFDNSSITYEKISETAAKCKSELGKISAGLDEIIDLQFIKEDSKLVG